MLENLGEYALRPFCWPQACAHTEDEIGAEKVKFLNIVCVCDKHTDAECAGKVWRGVNKQGSGWPVFSGVDDADKERMSAHVTQELVEFTQQYKAGEVGEEDHTDNIRALRDILTGHFREFLHERKYRFGRAHKLLNLYLKYLWCLGRIDTPPHCTFDHNIIQSSKKKLGGDLNLLVASKVREDGAAWHWTQSDDVNHYLLWVAGAKSAAEEGNHRSPAEWELIEWNKGEEPKHCPERCDACPAGPCKKR